MKYKMLVEQDQKKIKELAQSYVKIKRCDTTFLTTLAMSNWSEKDANLALILVKEFLALNN